MCRARERETARIARQKEREALETGNIVPRWWQDSSSIKNLSSPTELLALLDNPDPDLLLVVTFFTEECYSCRSLHPKLNSIAAAIAGSGVKFVKINGSDPVWQEFCSARYNLKTVPYFHFYKQGKKVSEMSASLNPQKLAQLRAEIEIQRGSHGRILFGGVSS